MIKDAVGQAQKIHRKIVEQTYDGMCTVIQKIAVKDPDTKVTSYKEVSLLTDQTCHLSYSGTAAAADSGTIAMAAQTIKLFLEPEIMIPPGSRIEVTQLGRTESYAQSGKAAVYSSHQEILLELWKERA